MAYYKVYFSINGVEHYTTGESTYPTKSDYVNKKHNETICMRNAMMFIAGYKDVKGIEDQVYTHNVNFTIDFD